MCSHLNIEDRRKYATFLAHDALYFKKDKITTETQKMICAVYGEGAVTDPTCRSGLQSFVIFLEMEISLWMMLHSRVNQLKLIAIE